LRLRQSLEESNRTRDSFKETCQHLQTRCDDAGNASLLFCPYFSHQYHELIELREESNNARNEEEKRRMLSDWRNEVEALSSKLDIECMSLPIHHPLHCIVLY
jgi:hypothetical protein